MICLRSRLPGRNGPRLTHQGAYRTRTPTRSSSVTLGAMLCQVRAIEDGHVAGVSLDLGLTLEHGVGIQVGSFPRGPVSQMAARDHDGPAVGPSEPGQSSTWSPGSESRRE